MATVFYHTATEDGQDQRLDNYLFKLLPRVPRTHIYRLLRTGQFRCNKKRVKATYRIQAGDSLRIPPIEIEERPRPKVNFVPEVLYEDAYVLVINKPCGMAVHGGSGLSWGMVELLRDTYPECANLALAHRLDKETSGVLVLAKTTPALRAISDNWHTAQKSYLTLLKGHLKVHKVITTPLAKNILQSGERMVKVNSDGKDCHTEFTPLKNFGVATLVKADIMTGRTHQIRVHASSTGFPVAGDDKYGDKNFNKEMAKRGLKRLFLHSHTLKLKHPIFDSWISVQAPLPKPLEALQETFK